LGLFLYDDIFAWEGWGGKLKLGHGKCHLRVLDMEADGEERLRYLRPYIAIVTDVTDSQMSVKSCAGHIATQVVRSFKLDPQRLLYLEHYPETRYGVQGEHQIAERFEAVEFTWHEGHAIKPRGRVLKAPMAAKIKELMELLTKPPILTSK